MLRKLISVICVLCLLMSMSISVLAADHSAGTYDEMTTAFTDTDPVVNIDVTADIDFDNTALEAGQDQTYNISTQNDSTLINAAFVGEGSVNISTDITSDNSIPALLVIEGCDVTVSGDITALETGVRVSDSDVTIQGNITAGYYGVYASNSNATIQGNIIADSDGVHADNSDVAIQGNITSGEDGVEAETSNVTMEGNLVTGDDGVEVYDSNVSIKGSITAEDEGIDAAEGSVVTMVGDIAAASDGIDAKDSTVHVDGNVSGTDGNPDEVDFSNPYGWSDGGNGMEAYNSTVTVTGNVSAGDSYGTYGYGGYGIYAANSNISVGGNVTGGNVIADPDTIAEDSCESRGGIGVVTDNISTVSIAGNVTGGNTNGEAGIAGPGMYVELVPAPEEMTGSITVAGTVSGGEAASETGESGAGLVVYEWHIVDVEPIITENNIPTISLGACDSIEVYAQSEEIASAIADSITVTGLPAEIEYEEAAEEESKVDSIWQKLHRQLRNAKKGDTITIDLGYRTYISGYLLDLARQMEVTLVIQWNGGEDITVKPTFEGDVANRIVKLTELAEMAK